MPLKDYTQDSVVEFIFKKYGKKCGISYDDTKLAIVDFYKRIDEIEEEIRGRTLPDEAKAKLTIAAFGAMEKLGKILAKNLR
jgi:hypothetical protein